jgi:hypothetical protein
VSTLDMCACQCYNYSTCVTGTYFGNNQTCILFSAYLSQGQLQPILNAHTNVFSFSNRTTQIGKYIRFLIHVHIFNHNFLELVESECEKKHTKKKTFSKNEFFA